MENLEGPKTYFHNSYLARKHVEIQNERLWAGGILKKEDNLLGGKDLGNSPKKIQKFLIDPDFSLDGKDKGGYDFK